MVGGVGQASQPDEMALEVCEQVRDRLEAEVGKSFDVFEVVSCAKQVVAGLNFFPKIRIAENEYIIARIYRHFSGEVSLEKVRTGIDADEEPGYF